MFTQHVLFTQYVTIHAAHTIYGELYTLCKMACNGTPPL